MPLSWRYGIAQFGSRPHLRLGSQHWQERSRQHTTRARTRASEEEIDRISRDCARNTGRYYADVIGMHRMDIKKFWDDDMTIDGLHYLKEAREPGAA